ncbi:MAG: hypothetical protein GTN82_05570, partial [Candidatus Aminicenantes bacterium]|nr:hypothetical protein [Candidatus Aminicenantes bacterium]
GEIKTALAELRDYTLDVGEDVVEGWIKYGENVADKFKKTFGKEGVIPEIKTFKSEYELGVNEPIKETAEIVTDLMTVYKN